ncbi:hypothetical protein B0T19DRAFT_80041 [Cercophora scortea]|uniref:Uncharacterized protein n=1 Tax=Cercophora scortea TaxID=314031 RepID=A0AAE0J633_9PEZI|nr:hypothetical protein B0T19DRAFT_80041 [Cercophora scortea]
MTTAGNSRARGRSSDWGHLSIRPHCGLCDEAIVDQDQYVTLYGNKDSTGLFYASIDARPRLFHGWYRDLFRPDNPRFTSDGLKICPQHLRCRPCLASAETITLHEDCLAVFRTECSTPMSTPEAIREAKDRLFVLAAWKSPWRNAPIPRFSGPREPYYREYLPQDIAERAGLGMFNSSLPEEIRQEIWLLSRPAKFWRFMKVVNIARLELPMAGTAPAGARISLSIVSKWSRGGSLELAAVANGVIRVTIDCEGIETIERLPAKPKFRRERFDNKVFAILDQKTSRAIDVLFGFGYARLGSSAGTTEKFPYIRLWDTPTPPDLERCMPPGYRESLAENDYLLLRTIDLASATGLTFIYYQPSSNAGPPGSVKLVAIHTHTPDSPSAQPTADGVLLPGSLLFWEYLPLSAEDHIVTFGVSRTMNSAVVPYWGHSLPHRGHGLTSRPIGPRFLFVNRISGCVSVGPACTLTWASTFLFQRVRPELLVYSLSEDGRGGVLLGSLGNLALESEQRQTSALYSLFTPDPEPPRLSRNHENWTPGDSFVHFAWWWRRPMPMRAVAFTTRRTIIAPLRDIRRVLVFKSDMSPTDIYGLIIEHGDGSRQVMGECRVGGPARFQKEYNNPRRIWISRASFSQARSYIWFGDKPQAFPRAKAINIISDEGKQLQIDWEPGKYITSVNVVGR